MIGQQVAHYEITEKIGAGGMGEVYKARDTRLGREVALKFLPETFALDVERLQRFDREAKLLAGLNHPNIAAIYGIEEAEGKRFLVLELIPGEDLSQRIAQGPVPVDEAVSVALQVADALEAAHDQGVIHRDLKPANIVATPEGTVKVLDFGLAKALDNDPMSGDISNSPTIMGSSPTLHGVILGTAGYMSPEQARGKRVDKRADVWAFGCVLYEMLMGKQLFGGETVSDTLASVLRSEPEWEALPKETPAAVVKLLRRCFERDPRERLRDIGEARIILDRVRRGEADDTSTVDVASTQRFGLRQVAVVAVVSVIAALFVGAAAWKFKPAGEDMPLRKFSLVVERSEGASPRFPAISPDGKSVAYTISDKLWVQDLNQIEAREIQTNGPVDMPFWSPDGSQIGYISKGKIFKVASSGGTSVKICDPQPSFTAGRGASWGADGRIVFAFGSTGLYQVNEQGGDAKILYDIIPEQDGDFHEPSWLPDSRGVVFVTHPVNSSPDTIELIAGDKRIFIVRVEGQRLWSPRYCDSGHIVYRRGGQNRGVWAVPFDIDKLEVVGEPFMAAADASYPSVASDGSMVYLRGASDMEFILRWVDRSGAVGDSVTTRAQGFGSPVLSPDETRLAVVSSDGDETDIWIHDLARGTRTRFTFAEGPQISPAWSPDGNEVYYHNIGSDSICVRSSDGTGAARPLVRGRGPDVSSDGQFIAYFVQGGKSQEDIWYVANEEGAEPVSFLVTDARELNPKISPDGRYVVYESNESGEYEVYVKRFPSGDGKWQVSIDGGEFPEWGRSGRTLYYRGDGCDIFEVPVQTESNLVLGTPTKVVDCAASDLSGGGFRTYTVSGDGERYILQQAVKKNRNTIDVGITVVQNWAREFQGRSTD